MSRVGKEVWSRGLYLSCCIALWLVPLFEARAEAVLEVGRFSAAAVGQPLPPGWKPLTFRNVDRQTEYRLVQDPDADTVVVRATSQASASGLITEVHIDPKQYPIARWSWKIDQALEKSDVRRKAGDDYPARLYITFGYEPNKVGWAKKLKYNAARALFGDIPIAAINYIWNGSTPTGTIVDNPFTDFAKMIVVRNNSDGVGRWVEEARNVYEDYRAAFGEEPPMINGVAIMTDTDNTRDAVTAYYGDIVFQQSVPPHGSK